MKSFCCFLSCFLPIVLCTTIDSAAQVNKPLLTDNPLQSHLDTAVHKGAKIYMANPGTVGLSIGVYKNGKSYIYNYGESKLGVGQLLQEDQFYNLGSLAKTFVGIILAEAVVENKVKLTDDIRKYLPGNYPNLAYQSHPVRLVDLANHTSGLPGSSREFPANVMDSIVKLTLSEQLHFCSLYTEDSLLKDMHNFQVDTIPGTKYRYNGNAMMVLILLLERIYKEPYEQLVTGYLRTHLQLYDTRTRIPVDQLNRFAQGYGDDGKALIWFDPNDRSQPDINTLLFWGGGPSMNSTMSDMLKYLKANLEEKDPAIRLSHQQTWSDSNGFGIGLCWMLNQDNNERNISHAGHTGIGFNTLCIFYPNEELGFMIFVNDNISQDKISELEKTIKVSLN